MKIRDAVSTDMKHGRFWKAERLLQHAQHAVSQLASCLLMEVQQPTCAPPGAPGLL